MDKGLRKKDWTTFFKLLEERKINPFVAAAFPLMEAKAANELLEGGQVVGNIALLDPELL